MRLKLTPLLFLILSVWGYFITPASHAQGLPELMYYKFDTPGTTTQNFASTPAGTNPAPLTGATIGGTGQYGTALVGNGGTTASNSVNTGWAPNLGAGSWTISMWLHNIPSSTTLQYFFGDVNTSSLRAFTGGVAGAGGIRLVGGGITAMDMANVIGTNPVVIHYVHDATAGNIKAYVNGVLNSTSTQTAVNFSGAGPFYVGGYPSNNGLPTGGLLDEFRLYNRALTAAEIATTWNVMLPYMPSPNDGGVTALNAPVSPTAPGSQPIQVTIKNYGTAPLTSAQIGWKVGTTTGTPYAWTGNLAPNASSSPITIGTHNFTNGTHAVKTWTNLPNGLTDGNHFNDTLTTTIIACNALTGTYTINQNAPATATNFTSFASALQGLNSCGISGPVVFNVVSGTGPYNEQINLGEINGVNATNTVTFNGNGNTITANPTGNLGAITLDGADFVKFDNLVITLDSTATAGWGVQFLNAADNNTISNCTINLPTNSTSTNFIGIGTGITYSTYGNHTNNSKIQNNTINGGYYGIRMNGTSTSATSAGNQITGNQIKDAYYYGIYLYYTGTMLVEGNDISRLGRNDGTTFYCLYNGYSQSNTISKNRIHGIGGSTIYGIYNYYGDSPAGAEAVIKNNVLYDFNNTGTTYALYSASADGTYFFHNTVDLRNTVNTGTVYGFYQTTAATNMKFQNNIISIDGGVSGTKYAVYYGVTTSAITSNNNDLYATNGTNVGYYSGAKATLADWQTASSQDANSVSVDPMFTNLTTGDLKPTNSTVNGIGTALTPAVTDDITGATRSTSNPDPGAHEFTPAANDAGIIAIITPTSPVQPGVNQPIQVTIKNFGMNVLTSATITANITGSATQTVTFNWTGSLVNNATANVTIGNYSFATGSYILDVCASNPNNATDGNPGNDCFATPVISCSALAGNYTINKNNPTGGTNFQSLADAVARVTSCGVSGPVTFTVAPNSGPYNEQMIIGAISGVNATNTVTFEGSGNTISANPTGGNLGAVTFDGGTYVKVNNFVITLDAAATAGWGVQFLNAADNNTISNCTINMPTNSTSTNFIGIGTGITYSTYGNHTNNSKIQNNTINGGYYGIRMNGTSTSATSAGNQITGNQIKDAYYYGIYLYYTGTMLVEGNDISRLGRNDGTTFYCLYNGYSQSNTISKNRIHGIGGSTIYGIYNYYGDSPAGAEAVIKNNVLYDFNNTGTTYALYSASADGTYFFHNTVDLRNTVNTGTVYGFYQTTAATNMKFQNNIISIDGGVSGTKYAVYYGVTTSAITSNNNDLYATNGANVGYYSGAKATLSDWQTASSQDANSISADPIFSSPATGDLQPTSVAVNNIGTPLASVTDDILGNPRSTTAPDLGAYEFTLNPNNVGIIAITGPVSGCGLTAQETITVTIKNYGTNTQTSILVMYSINNGTPVSQTYSGTLAPNATDTLVFTQTANLATAGPYTIVAATQFPGDADPTNDADTLMVANSLMPAGPVNINFEVPASGLNAMRVVTNARSNIKESTAAATGTGSTKGMIMDGVINTAWVVPSGTIAPWTSNPDHFSATYLCFTPLAGQPNDTLFLEFDLKQLYKTTHYNTNFRVTVNGQQIGGTYNPPFGGYGSAGAPWTHVKLDISSFLGNPTIEIGLESSVKEEYANGNGTANLIDNIMVQRIAGPTGIKENILQSNVVVFPNPSNGLFNLKVPTTTRNYSVEVMDLTGKLVKQQTVTNNSGTTQLNLNGTAKGIYILKIASEGNVATRKLIVE
ncbi:T9SS type A sorting domain-containing protein [Adhaeribacter terreus]|uniref:T9SS type A sorting domain-containing protein n=2 Tax=Adhaeribacter TaxID=299566 RepID=A0ABW0E9S5_9BACT